MISVTLSLFFFFFWPRHTACGILVPRPGMEPETPAVEAWSPNHWTSREVPLSLSWVQGWWKVWCESSVCCCSSWVGFLQGLVWAQGFKGAPRPLDLWNEEMSEQESLCGVVWGKYQGLAQNMTEGELSRTPPSGNFCKGRGRTFWKMQNGVGRRRQGQSVIG